MAMPQCRHCCCALWFSVNCDNTVVRASWLAIVRLHRLQCKSALVTFAKKQLRFGLKELCDTHTVDGHLVTQYEVQHMPRTTLFT